MSGVEIAGLVLGAFPIAVLAFDRCQDGCEGVRSLLNFKWTLSNFTRSLKLQQLFLRQNLEELLLPIVDSQEELEELCNNPMSIKWKSKQLDEDLRKNLSGSYQIYFEIINEMNATIKKIQKVLGIQDNDTALDMEDQFRRIKFCIKKRKIDQWASQLASCNDQISRILRNASTLGPLWETRRKSRTVKLLERVRLAALYLHETLSHSLKCQCSEPHRVSLLLEHRPQNNQLERQGDAEDNINFQVLFLALNRDTEQIWRETNIALHEFDPVEMLSADMTSTSATLASSSTAQGSASPLTLRDETNDLTATKENPSASQNDDHSNLQKWPPYPESRPRSMLLKEDKIWLRKYRMPRLQQAKKVPFHSQPQNISNTAPTPSPPHIIDLCETLCKTEHSLCSGLIQHRAGYTYLVTPVSSTSPAQRSMVGLKEILSDPKMKLQCRVRRRDRMQLAAIVASSILQLHSTPWLEPYLAKEKLGVHMGSNYRDTTVSRPFVERRFDNKITVQSKHNTREVMLRLAIVLMELCFGEALEDQPFHQKYLGPDGKPHDFTDLSTAMTWQKDVMGEAGEEYAEVVSRCIDCRFGLVVLSLEDVEFRRAFYYNVVLPLQVLSDSFGRNRRAAI